MLWTNFANMYFFADRSVFAIKLIDWAWIENPPQAIIIEIKGNMFELLFEIMLQPLVISNNPLITPFEVFWSIPIIHSGLDRNDITWVLESRVYSIEKKTIYPPMATMVSIPLDIDVFNNSPIGFIELLWYIHFLLSFLDTIPKSIPKVIAENMYSQKFVTKGRVV